MLTCLNAMRLTVSSSRFLKVMDKYAVTFDEMLAKQKLKGAEMMAKQHNLSQAALPLTSVTEEMNTVPLLSNVQHVNCEADLQSSPTCTEEGSQNQFVQNIEIPTVVSVSQVCTEAQVDQSSPLIEAAVIDPSNGFNIVVDNWDLRQDVRHMTSDHQNTDIHWVNHNIVENCISGNDLPDDKPLKNVQDVENKDLISSFADHKELYTNYLIHIQRILARRIPALHCLLDHVPKHIRHKHSYEMSKKSKKVNPKAKRPFRYNTMQKSK